MDDPRRENDHHRDKYLTDKLKKEAPGILAWLVKGCLAWQRSGGLYAPSAVTEATEDYRQEEDILGRFLNECAIPKQGAKAWAKERYQACMQWCEENGITARLNTTLGKKIRLFYLSRSRDKQGD